MFRRRTRIVLTVVGIVPVFVFVNMLVSATRARRESISTDWARRGGVELAAGRAASAAEDFETANQYARNRGAYRLQLGQALVRAGRSLEAESELQTTWAARPGDGMVNLQLARLYAGEGRVTDATRFYHSAIDGAWDTNAVGARRAARLELARFLLARGERRQAQAELIALAGDLPADATDPEVARLAGEVAFDTGDYRSARRELERAASVGLDADAARMLDLSKRIATLDPYARDISSRERVGRVVRAFGIADAALLRCPANSLKALRDQHDKLKPLVDERGLARDPDTVDETMTFASGVIAAVHTSCGQGQDDELALELLFQERRPRT